jgi:RNA polymerase sigma factor (sigma-70 family)
MLPPFQRLVDLHWQDVARLAHALAGPADGDDVAQQAWTQALVAYPRLASDRNLRGWLLTITARCATDVHRGRARRAVPVGELPEHAHPAGLTPSGLTASGADPAGEDPVVGEPLWRAVRALPERQRTALALRYVCDLDHAAVAGALGTTPAATRRLVSDALATLRGQLPGRSTADSTPDRTTSQEVPR